MSGDLDWAPDDFQALIEDLLQLQAPDGKLRPLLVLAAEDDRQSVVPLEAQLLRSERFTTHGLPRLIRDFGPSGATRAALVCSSWTTNFPPDDLAASYAFRRHLADGGTLSNWPGRVEAISVIVAERERPSWAIVGLLEPPQDLMPRRIAEWDVQETVQSGPILAALEQGVQRQTRHLHLVSSEDE